MKIGFTTMMMGMLMSAEGEGGGGGGAGAGAASGDAGGETQGAAGTEKPAGDAPPASPGVTREEFSAFTSKIDKVLESLTSGGTKAPPPAKGDKGDKGDKAEPPQWAKDIDAKLEALTTDRAKEAAGQRRRGLVDKVLADVPDSNRALAQLAVEGMLAAQGVEFTNASLNTDTLAKTLGQALRSQFGAQLFQDKGSPYAAIPKTGDGKYDFSGVRSLNEVPESMIRHIPDEVYGRLAAGAPASGNGARNGEIRPYNNFKN